jgi:hypothetical protein
MRARASEYLTRRSSYGESINVTTCHQSGPALLQSTSPAHPHPPLLLFLLAAPTCSAPLSKEERMAAQGRLDGAYTAYMT